MNTVFKLSIPVWVMFGIICSSMISNTVFNLYNSFKASMNKLHFISLGFKTSIVALSLGFLFFGTSSRIKNRISMEGEIPWTLDGYAFMSQAHYTPPKFRKPIKLSYDYQAIQWIQKNISGNAIVMESFHNDYYRTGGTRIASLTGLSGITGQHQSQQREHKLLKQRSRLQKEFWNLDLKAKEQIIHKLDLNYIYYGQLEERYHSHSKEQLIELEKNGSLETIYRNKGAVLYKTTLAKTYKVSH